VPYRGLTVEVQRGGASRYPHLLDKIRNEVLMIAACSRGWERPHQIEHFRKTFKLGPLYETDALALIYENGRLKGLAGAVNKWRSGAGSIVHLCSVGLLRELQARGFIPCLMRLLWQLCLQDEELFFEYGRGHLYVTAITQSPYLMAMLDRLFRVFPSPTRSRPDPDEVSVARTVVQRFDPHLQLEEDSFVLRKECEFFYRDKPTSLNAGWNDYCRRILRDQGDVFVAVGRAAAERLDPYFRAVQQQYPELTAALDRVVDTSFVER